MMAGVKNKFKDIWADSLWILDNTLNGGFTETSDVFPNTYAEDRKSLLKINQATWRWGEPTCQYHKSLISVTGKWLVIAYKCTILYIVLAHI